MITDSVLRGGKEHPFGYTPRAELGGAHADMNMDFGILRMKKGDVFTDDKALEKAYLLVYGEVEFQYADTRATAARGNCFDDSPTVLHLPKSAGAIITCLSDDAEINVMRTENERAFAPKMYLPSDTPDEYRGAGLMREASTRIVRTVLNYSNAPWANLVVGEVIGFPGKWSSYPPHHHPQPEIYYYKTNPQQGFGYAELGEDVVKVKNNDTVFIGAGLTHPHCTAPGYALWYLWVIRHIDGNPYTVPTFIDEHLWVLAEGAAYWPAAADQEK